MSKMFLVPPTILSGAGAINDLAAQLQGKGKKALLVTDSIMAKIGNVEKVTRLLTEAGIAVAVYDEVNSEPTDSIVAKGTALFQENGCDMIIALGGGSPIDAAKAIGVMAVSPGRISDYMQQVIQAEIPYLAAIPTTAGTGSEVTQFTIITDTKANVKMLLKGPAVMPKLAVVDPELTLTTPPKVTVATGIDALCHALEAYTSRCAQPLADTFALSAIRRIFKYLPAAYADGQNVTARLQMSLGALEAGIAFNNSSVTLIHGMSRPIGALFHVPHGVSNAILLAVCLRFAIHGDYGRFAAIARMLELADASLSDQEAAQALVEAVSAFCQALAVPTPAELGIDKDAFDNNLDKMASDALASGSPGNTLRQPSKAEIMEMYRQLWA